MNTLKNKNIHLIFVISIYFLLLIPGVITRLSKPPFEILLAPLLITASVLPAFYIYNFHMKPADIEKSRIFLFFKKYKTFIFIILCFLIPVLIYSQILKIQWGVIDDHEIFYYLGNDKKMSFSEFFPVLLGKTEVGRMGIATRFRPTYYSLRVFETILLGDHVHRWYFVNLIIIIVSAFLLLKILSREIGILNGTLMVAYVFTFPYLIQIFGRLGPSEIYAFGGLALFGWAFYRMIRLNKFGWLSWIALFGGTIICVGSKENFIILLFPLMFLIKYIKRWKWYAYLLYILSTAFSLFVVYGIGMALIRSKADIYSRSVKIEDRLSLFLQNLVSGQSSILSGVQSVIVLILLILGLIYIFYKLAREKNINCSSELKNLFITLVVLVVLIVSQQYFYNWNWPTGGRYDFPGMLYIPASLVVIYLEIGSLLRKIYPANQWEYIYKGVFACGLLMAILIKGYNPIYSVIQNNIDKNNSFKSALNQVVKTSRKNPEIPLIFESYDALDYEIIFSYERYLGAYSVTPTMYLRLYDYGGDDNNRGSENQLINSLLNISQDGDGKYIKPLNALNAKDTNCISIYLSYNGAGPFPSTCKYIINGYDR
jgi:hypothetical protein